MSEVAMENVSFLDDLYEQSITEEDEKSDILFERLNTLTRQPLFDEICHSIGKCLKSIYVEKFINNIHFPILEINNINKNFNMTTLDQLFTRKEFMKFIFQTVLLFREYECGYIMNQINKENADTHLIFKNFVIFSLYENYIDSHRDFIKDKTIIVFEDKNFNISSCYSKIFSYNFFQFQPFLDGIFDQHFPSKDRLCHFLDELYELLKSLNNYSPNFGCRKSRDVMKLIKDQTNKNKKNKTTIYKTIYSAYHFEFGYHHPYLKKQREYKFYEQVGEDTLKQLAYLKKSQNDLHVFSPINRQIEENKEAFDLVNKEYPNLFHASYSAIGFQGLDQIKQFKSFLKTDFHPFQKEHTEENRENWFSPITKKGWNFLLKQNRHYSLRAMKNLRRGVFACNLELNDAWLRTDKLDGVLNESEFGYETLLPFLEKRVKGYQGPVSKFSIFSKEKTFIYQNVDDLLSNAEKDYSEFITYFYEKNKDNATSDINEFIVFERLLVDHYLSHYRYSHSAISADEAFKKYSIFMSLYQYCRFNFTGNFDTDHDQFITYYHETKSKTPSLNYNFQFDASFNFSILGCDFYYSEIQPFFKMICDNLLDIIKENQFQMNTYVYFKSSLHNVKLRLEEIAISQIKDYLYSTLETFRFEIGHDGDFDYMIPEHIAKARFKKHIHKHIKSFDHLLELSDRWHDEIQTKQSILKENVFYDLRYLDQLELDKEDNLLIFEHFKLKPIYCSAELKNEGDIMHHCVFSYDRRCIDGEYLVFRVMETEENVRATLGVSINKNEQNKKIFNFSQIYSYTNNPVSERDIALAKQFINKLNSEIKTY